MSTTGKLDGRTRAIGLLEIWGGFSGLFAIGAASRAPALGVPQYLMLGVVGAFYLSSLSAGVLLTRGHKRGLPVSMMIQAIQFITLTIPQFRFSLYSGALVLIGVVGAEIELQAELASGFRIGIPASGTQAGLGINLLAIAAFAQLTRSRKRLRRISRTPNVHAKTR